MTKEELTKLCIDGSKQVFTESTSDYLGRATLEPKSQWIKCTPETMPPENKYVIVWCKKTGFNRCEWSRTINNEYRFFTEDNSNPDVFDPIYLNGTITHWQIPTPPPEE